MSKKKKRQMNIIELNNLQDIAEFMEKNRKEAKLEKLLVKLLIISFGIVLGYVLVNLVFMFLQR